MPYQLLVRNIIHLLQSSVIINEVTAQPTWEMVEDRLMWGFMYSMDTCLFDFPSAKDYA
jgi:hypothetical protein